MRDLSELSDRFRALLEVPPGDDEEILLLEADLRHLRETVHPATIGYVETLVDAGATESAAHVVRLLAIVTERALGPDAMSRTPFEPMRAVLDEVRELADELAAGAGAPRPPAPPPALLRLEADAASGRRTTPEMVACLEELTSWLEESGRTLDEDSAADVVRRIDAVVLPPGAGTPTLAEALQLFGLRARYHRFLSPVTTT